MQPHSEAATYERRSATVNNDAMIEDFASKVLKSKRTQMMLSFTCIVCFATPDEDIDGMTRACSCVVAVVATGMMV